MVMMMTMTITGQPIQRTAATAAATPDGEDVVEGTTEVVGMELSSIIADEDVPSELGLNSAKLVVGLTIVVLLVQPSECIVMFSVMLSIICPRDP